IYVVLGVNEEGYREILDFFVGGQESAYGWREILQSLYQRGVKEVLLGVFDGLPGLEEAFRAVYPKADVQRCVVHKVRSTLNRVRKKDQFEMAEDLKLIYRSPNKKRHWRCFNNLNRNGLVSIRGKSNLGPMSWMFSSHLWTIRTVFEV
ncbi:Transposase, Mutator family, partial [Parageobacillus thermantarcticus]